MEIGPTYKVLSKPFHPYTQALIASVPLSDPDIKREDARIKGDLPDQIDMPEGCRFAPRCLEAVDECHAGEPDLITVGEGHQVACFLNNEE